MGSLKKSNLFILFVLFITIFLYSGMVPVEIMEARNFIAAREMAAGGSWLLPTMNGELRIAKPPLPTWITAVFIHWAQTDTNLIANRIPAGISALLLVLFTYLIVNRITGDRKVALTSMIVLATSPLFMFSARKNAWDIYSVTAMTAAIWALAESFMRKKNRTVFRILFSLFMACAFYSKGPVPFGVMLLPFLTSYALAFGMKDLWDNRWGLLWSFMLCAAISAVWPAYVYLNSPHDALATVTKVSAAWFMDHTEPPWYYLLHFHVVSGIWIFFLFYGLSATFNKKDWISRDRLFVFWFILAIAFISIFPGKKLRYMLPAVVPGAIISAISIKHLLVESRFVRKIVYGAFCIVTGLAFLAAAGALAFLSMGRFLPLVGVPLLICSGLVLIYLYVKNETDFTPAVAVVGVCLSLTFLPSVLGDYLDHGEAEAFLHLRSTPAYAGHSFYSLGAIRPQIIWASGRIISPLNEQQLSVLIGSGHSFVLISEKKITQQPQKSSLYEIIRTERKTYYLYHMNHGTS